MKHVSWLVLVIAAVVQAAEPDVAAMYEVSTDGSTTSLAASEKGTFVISILAKNGAHVSDEAPLRIELSSKQLTLEKAKLTLADSVAKKDKGSTELPNPRFEVPFTPTAHGAATAEAKMTFFICTEKLCARQTKQLSIQVAVK